MDLRITAQWVARLRRAESAARLAARTFVLETLTNALSVICTKLPCRPKYRERRAFAHSSL
jgi:hypothetical protein